jgi:hypothetical protein
MSDRATPNSITSDLLNDTGFELLEHALFEAKRVVVGQDVMIERLFLCWLARGTACSKAHPYWRRRWPPNPWRASSAGRSHGCSSRPT